MTHFEIRKKFLKFFENNQHKVLPSSSLIPKNDPSLLFVNAGMNQFKNIFLGQEEISHKNVCTVQKCLRAGGKHNDIEVVGESSYHHTFFEMLGNFSFGAYFKKKAIALAWQFLTEEMEFSPEDLWITVYEKDTETYEIWKTDLKIPVNKIYRAGDKDNFWQMGEFGPCGPCTEIHYYHGKETRPDPQKFIEIWNLVFMEYYDTELGKREKLSTACVDTGMGLERLCSLVQKKQSNYHTDLFLETIVNLEKASSYKYDFKEKNNSNEQKAFRVIADHSRAISFLISDGVVPGSEGASYVLRRIIRRALYYSNKLNSKKNLLQIGTSTTNAFMGEIYPELKKEEALVQSIIEEEIEKFSNILKDGTKKLFQVLKSQEGKILNYEKLWSLYSTYGFPVDLARLIVLEKGYKIQEVEDKTVFTEQDSKSLAKKEKGLSQDILLLVKNLKSHFTGYVTNNQEGQISFLCLVESPYTKLTVLKEGQAWMILNKTCFYPEGGGPIGDRGWIQTATGKAKVLDCIKQNRNIFHKVQIEKGKLQINQKVETFVPLSFRNQQAGAHTSTHLLHASLRSVLGESVRQAGSLIEPGRLRFDFTHSKPLSKRELKQIEEIIARNIEQEEDVCFSMKFFDEAKKEGALLLQGENYEKRVRVIRIGEQTSVELCGGIHVKNTREIENFKIVSEKGIQSGVRRITAYTGSLARFWEAFLEKQNLELRQYLALTLPEKEQAQVSEKEQSQVSDTEQAQVSDTEQSQVSDTEQAQVSDTEQSQDLFVHKEKQIWLGKIEKENPFLKWIEAKDKELKDLKRRIVHFEDKKFNRFSVKDLDFINIKSSSNPFAEQNLEFREALKLPLPKTKDLNQFFLKHKEFISVSFVETFLRDNVIFQELFEEENNPLIECIKTKEEEVNKLYQQWETMKKLGFTKEDLVQKSRTFKIKDITGQLLIVCFPLEDRNILSDILISLASKISTGVVIIIGKDKGKYPILISLTKDLEKVLSAGEILKKTIAPLYNGKGGGKVSFAQGSLENEIVLSQLEDTLLEKWNS